MKRREDCTCFLRHKLGFRCFPLRKLHLVVETYPERKTLAEANTLREPHLLDSHHCNIISKLCIVYVKFSIIDNSSSTDIFPPTRPGNRGFGPSAHGVPWSILPTMGKGGFHEDLPSKKEIPPHSDQYQIISLTHIPISPFHKSALAPTVLI
jgi:hypothetical protein